MIHYEPKRGGGGVYRVIVVKIKIALDQFYTVCRLWHEGATLGYDIKVLPSI